MAYWDLPQDPERLRARLTVLGLDEDSIKWFVKRATNVRDPAFLRKEFISGLSRFNLSAEQISKAEEVGANNPGALRKFLRENYLNKIFHDEERAVAHQNIEGFLAAQRDIVVPRLDVWLRSKSLPAFLEIVPGARTSSDPRMRQIYWDIRLGRKPLDVSDISRVTEDVGVRSTLPELLRDIFRRPKGLSDEAWYAHSWQRLMYYRTNNDLARTHLESHALGTNRSEKEFFGGLDESGLRDWRNYVTAHPELEAAINEFANRQVALFRKAQAKVSKGVYIPENIREELSQKGVHIPEDGEGTSLVAYTEGRVFLLEQRITAAKQAGVAPHVLRNMESDLYKERNDYFAALREHNRLGRAIASIEYNQQYLLGISSTQKDFFNSEVGEEDIERKSRLQLLREKALTQHLNLFDKSELNRLELESEERAGRAAIYNERNVFSIYALAMPPKPYEMRMPGERAFGTSTPVMGGEMAGQFVRFSGEVNRDKTVYERLSGHVIDKANEDVNAITKEVGTHATELRRGFVGRPAELTTVVELPFVRTRYHPEEMGLMRHSVLGTFKTGVGQEFLAKEGKKERLNALKASSDRAAGPAEMAAQLVNERLSRLIGGVVREHAARLTPSDAEYNPELAAAVRAALPEAMETPLGELIRRVGAENTATPALLAQELIAGIFVSGKEQYRAEMRPFKSTIIGENDQFVTKEGLKLTRQSVERAQPYREALEFLLESGDSDKFSQETLRILKGIMPEFDSLAAVGKGTRLSPQVVRRMRFERFEYMARGVHEDLQRNVWNAKVQTELRLINQAGNIRQDWTRTMPDVVEANAERGEGGIGAVSSYVTDSGQTHRQQALRHSGTPHMTPGTHKQWRESDLERDVIAGLEHTNPVEEENRVRRYTKLLLDVSLRAPVGWQPQDGPRVSTAPAEIQALESTADAEWAKLLEAIPPEIRHRVLNRFWRLEGPVSQSKHYLTLYQNAQHPLDMLRERRGEMRREYDLAMHRYAGIQRRTPDTEEEEDAWQNIQTLYDAIAATDLTGERVVYGSQVADLRRQAAVLDKINSLFNMHTRTQIPPGPIDPLERYMRGQEDLESVRAKILRRRPYTYVSTAEGALEDKTPEEIALDQSRFMSRLAKEHPEASSLLIDTIAEAHGLSESERGRISGRMEENRWNDLLGMEHLHEPFVAESPEQAFFSLSQAKGTFYHERPYWEQSLTSLFGPPETNPLYDEFREGMPFQIKSGTVDRLTKQGRLSETAEDIGLTWEFAEHYSEDERNKLFAVWRLPEFLEEYSRRGINVWEGDFIKESFRQEILNRARNQLRYGLGGNFLVRQQYKAVPLQGARRPVDSAKIGTVLNRYLGGPESEGYQQRLDYLADTYGVRGGDKDSTVRAAIPHIVRSIEQENANMGVRMVPVANTLVDRVGRASDFRLNASGILHDLNQTIDDVNTVSPDRLNASLAMQNVLWTRNAPNRGEWWRRQNMGVFAPEHLPSLNGRPLPNIWDYSKGYLEPALEQEGLSLERLQAINDLFARQHIDLRRSANEVFNLEDPKVKAREALGIRREATSSEAAILPILARGNVFAPGLGLGEEAEKLTAGFKGSSLYDMLGWLQFSAMFKDMSPQEVEDYLAKEGANMDEIMPILSKNPEAVAEYIAKALSRRVAGLQHEDVQAQFTPHFVNQLNELITSKVIPERPTQFEHDTTESIKAIAKAKSKYSRVTMDTVKQAASAWKKPENKNFRIAGYGLAALTALGIIRTVRNKDHTPEQMSPALNMPDMSTFNPQYVSQGGGYQPPGYPGVTYHVVASGNFNQQSFQNQMQSKLGGPVNGTIYPGTSNSTQSDMDSLMRSYGS